MQLALTRNEISNRTPPDALPDGGGGRPPEDGTKDPQKSLFVRIVRMS
jgi:hypothetical protein